MDPNTQKATLQHTHLLKQLLHGSLHPLISGSLQLGDIPVVLLPEVTELRFIVRLHLFVLLLYLRLCSLQFLDSVPAVQVGCNVLEWVCLLLPLTLAQSVGGGKRQ